MIYFVHRTFPQTAGGGGLGEGSRTSIFRVKIERLQELGHELRRPEADYLRDGIYELRIGLQGVNYRILYFFYGKVTAVLAHSLLKERAVPAHDLNEALRRKHDFERAPAQHTYQEA